MGVWSPWERDKVRQDLLGFISLGPAAEGRGQLHAPTTMSPQGLGDLLAHAQHRTPWDVVVKQQP